MLHDVVGDSVANQKGRYAAKKLNKLVKDRDYTEAFVFKNQGSLAYIGDWFSSRLALYHSLYSPTCIRKAIYDRTGAEHGLKTKESGRVAWLLWRSAYFTMTLSWRNKFRFVSCDRSTFNAEPHHLLDTGFSSPPTGNCFFRDYRSN